MDSFQDSGDTLGASVEPSQPPPWDHKVPAWTDLSGAPNFGSAGESKKELDSSVVVGTAAETDMNTPVPELEPGNF